MQNPTPTIQIQNLVKTFKGSDVAVVNDVTFSVNTNEVFGLLGPNGAGKTTIISMLCQLFEPTSGKIVKVSVPAFATFHLSHTELVSWKSLLKQVPNDGSAKLPNPGSWLMTIGVLSHSICAWSQSE